MKGIFQDDSLFVLLFILATNPLSFLLLNLKGHQCGTKRNNIVTHKFFVDDLKLYANNINPMKILLDLITKFPKDTGMTFGEDKCTYKKKQKGEINQHYQKTSNQWSYNKLMPELDSQILGPQWKHYLCRTCQQN